MTDAQPNGLAEVELPAALRTAMRRLPGPVSLVTTHDEAENSPAGMAASAVIPVSMEPPSMLVAVNRQSRCHTAIEGHGRFCINLLGTEQAGLVQIFSTSELRGERFNSSDWEFADQIPYLPTAMASIFCTVSTTLIHGTHELFIGNAYDVRMRDADGLDPLGWMEGGFARFGALD